MATGGGGGAGSSLDDRRDPESPIRDGGGAAVTGAVSNPGCLATEGILRWEFGLLDVEKYRYWAKAISYGHPHTAKATTPWRAAMKAKRVVMTKRLIVWIGTVKTLASTGDGDADPSLEPLALEFSLDFPNLQPRQ